MIFILMPYFVVLPLYFYLAFKIFRHYVPLDAALSKNRYSATLLLGAVSMILMSIPGLEFTILDCAAIAVGAMAAYFFLVFHATLSPDSLLSVTIHPFKSTHAKIHLASPTQSFNRQTYRELPAVVERLAKLGFTTVTLTSPMLGKNHTPRDVGLLNVKLKHLIHEIDSQPVKVRPSPLDIMALWIAKYLQKSESVKKLNLYSWYQLTFTLKTPDLQ